MHFTSKRYNLKIEYEQNDSRTSFGRSIYLYPNLSSMKVLKILMHHVVVVVDDDHVLALILDIRQIVSNLT